MSLSCKDEESSQKSEIPFPIPTSPPTPPFTRILVEVDRTFRHTQVYRRSLNERAEAEDTNHYDPNARLSA